MFKVGDIVQCFDLIYLVVFVHDNNLYDLLDIENQYICRNQGKASLEFWKLIC